MELLIPIAVALVSLYVGYLLRGLVEKRRRKNSLVHGRLDSIDAAISHIDRAGMHLYGFKDAGPGRRREWAVMRTDELHSTGSRLIPAGLYAATALGEETLATTIREAADLLNSLEEGYDATVFEELETKLDQAHTQYEALSGMLA